MKYILITLLTFLLHVSAFASAPMKKLFTETFTSNYSARDCFNNIVRLLEMAEKRKININNANILRMTNEGTSVFMHIKAEHARGIKAPEDKSWYFHAVLEMDGLIYDYDFGQTPSVLPVSAYFDKMFFSEVMKFPGDFKYVGAERKKEDYQVEILDGISVLRAKSRHDMPKGEKLRFGRYLKQF